MSEYYREVFGPQSLGEILRAQREARGWSIAKAAAYLGIKPAALGTYERCERNPPVETVVSMLNDYGLRLVVVDRDATTRRIAQLRAELELLVGAP